jgi:GPH family glycoside/pentoside/hexuronide:cation symporter
MDVNPAAVAASDVVFANIYPYCEGVDIKDAAVSLNANYQALVNSCPGKEIIVSETRWPSDGNPVRKAEPSPQNAALYFLNVVSWAAGRRLAQGCGSGARSTR